MSPQCRDSHIQQGLGTTALVSFRFLYDKVAVHTLHDLTDAENIGIKVETLLAQSEPFA